MQITEINIEKILPYARNSRTHSDEQVAQIAASIKEFGFLNPVLIDDDLQIIAGHGRVLAARKLELKKVPCIKLSHLTDTQKRAYIIADNKLALNAGWDLEMLKVEIQELMETDIDLKITGFADIELSNLMLDKESGENNPYEEWKDMPEFEQGDKTSFRHVIVHFDLPDDVAEFFSIIGQSDTGQTKSIWFPEKENMDTESRRYGNE